MEENLTPKQVAEALQVSESSIKRWCDRGVIRSRKTMGGHRRIPIDALMSFLESTNRQLLTPAAIGLGRGGDGLGEAGGSEAAESAGDPPADSAELQLQFEAAVVRGDEAECRRILIQWYGRHESFALLADQLIAKTFHRLGAMWECGEIEVFQERRGCEVCLRLVHEFRRLIAEPRAGAPVAIGGAVAGDHYMLPTQLVEVVLRESGWRAFNLGTHLPLSTFVAAARRERPQLLWLSVSHLEDVDKFVDEFTAMASALPSGVHLVVGGRALTDAVRPRLPFTAHCDTLVQLAKLARNLKSSSTASQVL